MTKSTSYPFGSIGLRVLWWALSCSGQSLGRATLLWALLALPLRAAAPANDLFPGQWLTGNAITVEASNQEATGELGEPSHAGNPPTASVWWTWVAPDDGQVTVETLNSALDTVLAVYQGDSVTTLKLVAENDDAPGLASSAVSFLAIGGQSYRIVVDGYLGVSGNIRLHLRLPVEPAVPRVVTQPAGQAVPANLGTNVTFSVVAEGSFPLSFAWQKNGEILAGATNASLTLTNVTTGDEGAYSVVITNPFGTIISSAATLSVLGGLGQDFFTGRIPFVGRSVAVFGHNFGATVEPNEPMHGGINQGASIWWSWTAAANGLVELKTRGSTNAGGAVLDTVLAVYRGQSLGSLTPLAANDDEELGGVTSSRVFFRATAGTTYQIAVSGVLNTNGTFATGFVSLRLEQSDDNDFFANALEFPADVATVFDHNGGATEEPGEPNHAGNLGGKSVWWCWVAPSDGTFVLDTVGSSIDTVLAVYTGNSIGALTLVGEDDNRSDGGASLVKFVAVKGTIYRLAVDGYNHGSEVSEGSLLLNLNPALELNDDFAGRDTLSGQTNHVTTSNVGASKELGEPLHGGNAGGRSVWWTWTAPITAPVVVTTRDSSFDTALAVYSGAELGSLALIAENDDSDPLNPAAGSFVTFAAIAGQSYQIAVDGYRSDNGTVAAGTVVLRLIQANPPAGGANDQFASRFSLSGQTNGAVGNNREATREPGEPHHAGNDGGQSLWWSWIAPRSAPVRFDTVGSEFDTILAVYQGSQVDDLLEVAADVRSAGGGRSVVTFEAVEGTEYVIAVDGFNDGMGVASGRVILRMRQYDPGSLHANDDFENASPISDAFPVVVGSNIGATRQAGEPAHGNLAQGRSVWWTWTASADGPITVSTAGSEFDTTLAVYTGRTVGSLELVSENDDLDPGHLQSRVTFPASAGTEYRIAVDGYANEIGMVMLSVLPSADVGQAPEIQQSPVDQTRFAGGAGGGTMVSFRVVATGASPLSYQWFHNGSPVAGATTPRLVIDPAGAQDAGTYRVTITNAFGETTSEGAELTWLNRPFNDAFVDRSEITGLSQVVRGSLLDASKEPSEPDHGGEVGGRSVWWKWTATTNGVIEVHTLGSSLDTLLAVYTGNLTEGLTRVASNDDLLLDQVYASRVTFQAVAGVEYQIAVDSSKTNSTAASVVLTLGPPAAPVIVLQPSPVNLVEATDTNFRLEVGLLGPTPADRYQWNFNGFAIPGATNSTFSPGGLSSANSGVYSVAVTNGVGGVVSSNAVVLVRVPPQLRVESGGTTGPWKLSFSEPDERVAGDTRLFEAQRRRHFEIQQRSDLGDSTVPWMTTSGVINFVEGRFWFEEGIPSPTPQNFYRVVELPSSLRD